MVISGDTFRLFALLDGLPGTPVETCEALGEIITP
jgi:hypothetical protein